MVVQSRVQLASAPATALQLRGLRIVVAQSRQRHSCSRRLQVVRAEAPVVGIDLGTTNSAIAVVEDGVPRIISTACGRTTPSVVSFGSDGAVLVGKAAAKLAASQPGTTFFSTKRLIGRKYKHIKATSLKLPYSVHKDDEGAVTVQCRSERLRPQDVAQHVLRYLLAAAEADFGVPVEKAVISVPAYFDQEQQAATIAAGKMAGLETVRLIREPVAAALAYGVDLQKEATVLVADLGGGTFDVALLEVGNGTVEVLSTGGDSALGKLCGRGGDDWDAAIAKYLIASHLDPAGVKVKTPEMRARLRALAQTAKEALSGQKEVLLRVPSGRGKEVIEMVLTAQRVESLTAPLYRRALLPLEDACTQASALPRAPPPPVLLAPFSVSGGLPAPRGASDDNLKQLPKQAGLNLKAEIDKAARERGIAGSIRKMSRRAKAKQPLNVQLRPKRRPPISEVLLVGGATRMPAFSRFITNVTGLVPRPSAVDPDEAVAVGASVQAALLSGQMGDMMVMDVWQAALMRALASKATPADLERLSKGRDDDSDDEDDDVDEDWELLSEELEDPELAHGEEIDAELLAELKAELLAEQRAQAFGEP